MQLYISKTLANIVDYTYPAGHLPYTNRYAAAFSMNVLPTEYPKSKFTPLIGEPLKLLEKKGSTVYFIKRHQFANSSNELNDLTNFKGIIELYSKGLLLRVFKSNKNYLLPIPHSSIQKVTVTEGEEEIDPFFLSPMWILLKLGVHANVARYFQLRWDRYIKYETELIIATDGFIMELVSNGFTFPSQEKFFKRIDLGDKLQIEKACA